MQITRSSLDTNLGASEWFTGTVMIDTVATPVEAFNVWSANVHFSPGSRTAWHTHSIGQSVYVTDGVGLCQREGEAAEVIRPGDRVFFEAGENHWHGAAPNRFMTHLSIVVLDDDGEHTTWGELVTDEQYGAH